MVKKYYFGYIGWMGLAHAVKWFEENGVPVGGKKETLPNNRWEITKQDYLHKKLCNLEGKRKYKPLETLT